jgi:hypothetical protein
LKLHNKVTQYDDEITQQLSYLHLNMMMKLHNKVTQSFSKQQIFQFKQRNIRFGKYKVTQSFISIFVTHKGETSRFTSPLKNTRKIQQINKFDK